ncbi:MAG: SHOCT domain-containing protein [Candidatus Aminicenantia bacterium]
MMWGGHWMFGGFMWIFWIAALIGLVFFVKWLVQQSKASETNYSENSLEILKRRYAQGGIDKDEFEQKKKDLLS